jgi:hypothetical protein
MLKRATFAEDLKGLEGTDCEEGFGDIPDVCAEKVFLLQLLNFCSS